MKKALSIILAGTMVATTMGISALSVSADEGKSLGSYCTHPTYKPSNPNIKTNRLMFAMPTSWENDITKKDREGGLCGLYWWSGFDTPGSQGWSNAWPGWQATKVKEEGVNNLWEINVPTYGNGEDGNATQIIWNNFIDGGTETDDAKNPYYKAANQTRDFPGQYYSRTDEHETYDILIRYIYMKSFKDAGVAGIDKLDTKSDNFWVEANKLCAVKNGNKWDDLSADEKTFQVDLVLDKHTPDLSEFGTYASNFFNEDLVKAPEESQGFGQSFTFDNMVFVVSFDPDKMVASPQSGKIGYDGDFYFYYGNGEYGSWPTKALNTEMGGVTGNFTVNYPPEGFKPPEPTTTIPGPNNNDAKSSTNDSDNNSNTNNNGNGAIATGQVSVAVIALVVLFAGVAIVMFARKKEQD